MGGDLKCVLLDVEGTTSSIRFVHDEMFPVCPPGGCRMAGPKTLGNTGGGRMPDPAGNRSRTAFGRRLAA